MIIRLIDRLAERYAEGENKLEAMRAREEYFDRGGKVFDDDAELFESRMASFLEWYVLERAFKEGPPPAVRALAEDKSLSSDDRRGVALLAASHRSLFQLHAIEGNELDVEDVVGGARFRVTERRKTSALTLGDLFEARVIWDGETVIFGRTFLFHLARNHIRWHRLGHVGAAKLYRQDQLERDPERVPDPPR